MVGKNRFKALESRVIQYGVREMRRQEVVRNMVKCFVCGEKGHKKWECPRKNERSRKEEVAPLSHTSFGHNSMDTCTIPTV